MRAWRNTLLRFGLVNIPVSIAPAKSDRPAVSAHTYDAATGARVKQAWTVDGASIVADTFRAYDVDGEAVRIETPEIDGETGIDLEAYVETASVDPLFYDAAYAMFPAKGGAEGLGLVADLLRKSGRMLAGTGRFTDRPRSVVIRWSDAAEALVLHTLTYSARVRFEEMAKVSADLVTPAPALLAQATLLTDALADAYLPADVDPLEAALCEALCRARPHAAKGKAASTPVDLLATLRADVESKSKSNKSKTSKSKTLGGMDREPRGSARR